MIDGDEDLLVLFGPNTINISSDSSSEEDGGRDNDLPGFKESDEVIHSIRDLAFQFGQEFCSEVDFDLFLENCYDRIKCIFDKYQEQPHLLDPYLEDLISSIWLLINNQELPKPVQHQAFKYLNLIIKVRGYTKVVGYLPQEVHGFETALRFLEEQNPTDTRSWETRHCLLIWLSAIVTLPFDMQVLDNGLQENNSFTNRLINVCKVYLTGSDLCRDAAAIVLARFVTRDDVKVVHLQPFLDWLCETVLESDAKDKEWRRFGPMACLAAILKDGNQEDLLPLAPDLLRSVILKMKPSDLTYPLSAKSFYEIISSLGLVFLRPERILSLHRGGSTLALGIDRGEGGGIDRGEGGGDVGVSVEPEHTQPTVEGEGDAGSDNPENEVGEELEEIIQELIEGLKNNKNIARWSAAKGIGRIVDRLSQSDGDEVISFVIGLFDGQHSEDSWHGACLGIGELAKRNLIPLQRLPQVMQLLISALLYENQDGRTSIGASVRVAACYACCRLARAYQPPHIEPYILELATNLISVACFDREVRCRRAAAAAFQECVGCLGNVPHGTDINFALEHANINLIEHTFLIISPKVAEYQEYTLGLIDHLLYHKINNRDPEIRKIVAEALHKLTSYAPEYAATHCLQNLLHRTDAYGKHGSILAIGEIVHALSVLGKLNLIENESLETIKDLLSFMQDELMMYPTLNSPTHALLSYIKNGAMARLPFNNKEQVIIQWQGIVDKCLNNETDQIRNDAAAALQELCIAYYGEDSADGQLLRTEIIQRYLAGLNTGVLSTRIGSTLALGAFPKFMLGEHLSEVIHALEKCTTITQETLLWGESRKAAVTALSNLCTCIGLEKKGAISCYDYLQDILDVLLQCMKHTVDNRGDFGVWVCEEVMLKIKDILLMAVDEAPELLLPNTVARVFTSIAQQAVESIDRSRAVAGRVFSSLLMKQDNPVPHIPAEDKVRTIFTEEVCTDTNWTTEEAISLFIRLQTEPPFSYTILLGLTSTIGSLIEPLAERRSLLLHSHYLDQPKSAFERLSNVILRIFESNLHNDRFTVRFLHLLNRMLTWNGLLEVLRNPDSSFATRLLELGKKEISNSTNAKKLTAGIDLFCQLIQVPGEVSRGSLVQLCIMLLRRFPLLRDLTANKLIDALTMYGENMKLAPENTEEVIRILEETNWTDSDRVMLRAKHKAMCALLKIPAPLVAGGGTQ